MKTKTNAKLDFRELKAESERRVRRRLSDLGELPECVDIERRKYLEDRPAEWLREMLPDIFFVDFSKSQLEFIDVAWRSIEMGVEQGIEAYRGLGKTSIVYGLLLLAVVKGLSKHSIVITAEGGNSCGQAVLWFRSILEDEYSAEGEDRTIFNQYYPEICYPFQRKEGRTNRPLELHNRSVKAELRRDKIIFPTVYLNDGSPSSSYGAMIRFTSITSGDIRGANYNIQGLGSYRPRIVILDDIQSDRTAKSETEAENIVSIIKRSVSLLSGRSRDGGKDPLTILSAITENYPNDVACQLKATPEFATRTIPFVTRLPQTFDAWRKYKEVYTRELQNVTDAESKSRAYENITKWYKKNRELFDEVIVDDDRLREPWQLDGVQRAVTVWSKSEPAFWAELQNDAEKANAGGSEFLSIVDITRKLRRNKNNELLMKNMVPNDVDIITAHIDCGEHYLNYEVCGFSKDFSVSHVIDYGIYPEQPLLVRQKHKYTSDIQELFDATQDKFDKLGLALCEVVENIFDNQYFDEAGNPIELDEETEFIQNARKPGEPQRRFRKLALCGVDCSDGEMEFYLWKHINNLYKHRPDLKGRVIPAYGDCAKSRMLRYWRLKPEYQEWRREKRNATPYDWIENPERVKPLRAKFPDVYAALLYDANTAKTRISAGWEAPLGRKGATTLCASDNKNDSVVYASQMTSETYVIKKKNGIDYRVWDFKKPSTADNEFLDVHSACRALAEYVGCAENTELF